MSESRGEPDEVGGQDQSEPAGEQWPDVVRCHGGQLNSLQGEVRDWLSKMAEVESNITALQLNLAEVKQKNDNLGSKFLELDQKCSERHDDMVKRLKVTSDVLSAKFEVSQKQFAEHVDTEIKRSSENLTAQMSQLHAEQNEFAAQVDSQIKHSSDSLSEQLGGQIKSVVDTVKDLFEVIRGRPAPAGVYGSPSPNSEAASEVESTLPCPKKSQFDFESTPGC